MGDVGDQNLFLYTYNSDFFLISIFSPPYEEELIPHNPHLPCRKAWGEGFGMGDHGNRSPIDPPSTPIEEICQTAAPW